MLKAEGQAARQRGGAAQQREGHAQNGQPTGLARRCIRPLVRVEARIPFFSGRQAKNNGGERAGGHGETQQRNQHPAQSVVLAELLHALNAINPERRRNRHGPAQRIAQAVQVKAVQAQRAANESEPGGQSLVFHACIKPQALGAGGCRRHPGSFPSARHRASGRTSSRRT